MKSRLLRALGTVDQPSDWEAARFGVSCLTPAAVCLNPALDCVQAGDGSRHAA